MNDDKKYFVYKHVNNINNKVYIGITCKSYPELRWGLNGSGYNLQVFGKAVNKYGWDSFEHIILYSNVTEEFAKKKERELIKEQRDKFGIESCYNISSGGETGFDTYSIYCNETGEVFSSAKEVLEKQKHYKDTTERDIIDCCRMQKEKIKRPWTDSWYHYQFNKASNYSIEEIEEKVKTNLENKEIAHKKSVDIKNEKREKWIKENELKYKDDKTRKQCCVCGKFFKKSSNNQKYCGKCRKEVERLKCRNRVSKYRKNKKSNN